MMILRRKLKERIAELENELSAKKRENEELSKQVLFCENGICPKIERLVKENSILKKENAELRACNSGLASSVTELKSKIRSVMSKNKKKISKLNQ